MSRSRVRKLRRYKLAALSSLMIFSVGAGEAHATRRLSAAEAIAIAKARRSESTQAEIDVKLADVELLRAALQRVRLTVDANYSDGYQQLNVGAPATLCASLAGACDANSHEQLLVGTASLSIPVWSGMAVEASWTRARRLQAAAEAQRRAAWRSVALEAATAYWSVRRAELLLEAEKKAYERNYQITIVTKARADAGISPVVDYTRARSSALRQEAAISDLQGRAEEARAQLAAALQIEDEIVLTDPPPEKIEEPPPLPIVLAEAERKRPELQAARATWEAQEQQARITSGAFWPQVSLFGNADARNQVLGIPQPTMVGSFSAGVKVDWQIFDSLSTYTTLRQDRLAADRLAEERKRLVYVVRAEVQSAYGSLKAAIDRRGPLREALQAVQSGVEVIRRRYEAGTALLIEVLQAQDELAQLELDLVNNSLDMAQLQANLDAARGSF